MLPTFWYKDLLEAYLSSFSKALDLLLLIYRLLFPLFAGGGGGLVFSMVVSCLVLFL